jgi:hypothetical protein
MTPVQNRQPYRHVTEYKETQSMGRKPENQLALTGAERQARYRARQDNGLLAPVRGPTKARKLTRPQRWNAAVTALLTIQAEYAAWLQAMPEATRDTATGEALLAITELDLDELATVQPPRGFGRD